MHDRMKKILSKKRDLSDVEHSAKLDVVKQMRDMAAGEMGGKLDGIKKVSVMSNDKQGLEKGLDKAKQILSSSEMEDDKNEAENDYGDYKSALDEHSDDEPNDQKGFVHQDGDDGHNYSEGGQVDPKQDAQDSMRKAFKFNEGGEVDPDESEDDSEESPEEESEESDDQFEGLDTEELKQKLRELMKLHQSMGKK